MRIHKRIKNGVAFVEPRGMLIGGSEIENLDKILTELEGNGVKKCVIDFTNIRLINCLGAGFLIKKKNNFRRANKDFRIVNINGTVKNYMNITRISECLH